MGSSKASPGGKSGKPSSKKQKEEGTEASDGKVSHKMLYSAKLKHLSKVICMNPRMKYLK